MSGSPTFYTWARGEVVFHSISGLEELGALYSMSGLEGDIVRSPMSVRKGGVPLPAMSRLEK